MRVVYTKGTKVIFGKGDKVVVIWRRFW